MILHVHGGPHEAHGPLPLLDVLVLVARGFVVLCGNPRGSVGYGDAHAAGVAGAHGVADADDLLRFVDAVASRGLGDPTRVGVLGHSYGGYLAAQLLGTTDRFAAGVVENAITNLVAHVATTDIGLLAAEAVFGADPEALWSRSPVANATAIEAPLLILHAEEDLRCNVSQSEELFGRLSAQGRLVEYARFPGESHLITHRGRPDRRALRLALIADWFDAHLRGS